MARQDKFLDDSEKHTCDNPQLAQLSDSQMTPEAVSDNDVMSSSTQIANVIYHERQSRQLCALHALNNLFQSSKAFEKNDLDTICKTLAPQSRILNPHRSALGIGCYDINVLITALSNKGYEVVWFDKRKDPSCLILDNIFGFILNIPNPATGIFSIGLSYIPLPSSVWTSSKHWIAVRKVGHNFYDLDSKLVLPALIGDGVAMIEYLRSKNSSDQIEILMVVKKEIAESQAWQKT